MAHNKLRAGIIKPGCLSDLNDIKNGNPLFNITVNNIKVNKKMKRLLIKKNSPIYIGFPAKIAY